MLNVSVIILLTLVTQANAKVAPLSAEAADQWAEAAANVTQEGDFGEAAVQWHGLLIKTRELAEELERAEGIGAPGVTGPSALETPDGDVQNLGDTATQRARNTWERVAEHVFEAGQQATMAKERKQKAAENDYYQHEREAQPGETASDTMKRNAMHPIIGQVIRLEAMASTFAVEAAMFVACGCRVTAQAAVTRSNLQVAAAWLGAAKNWDLAHKALEKEAGELKQAADAVSEGMEKQQHLERKLDKPNTVHTEPLNDYSKREGAKGQHAVPWDQDSLSAQTFPDVMGILAVSLAGFFAGSGVIRVGLSFLCSGSITGKSFLET